MSSLLISATRTGLETLRLTYCGYKQGSGQARITKKKYQCLGESVWRQHQYLPLGWSELKMLERRCCHRPGLYGFIIISSNTNSVIPRSSTVIVLMFSQSLWLLWSKSGLRCTLQCWDGKFGMPVPAFIWACFHLGYLVKRTRTPRVCAEVFP